MAHLIDSQENVARNDCLLADTYGGWEVASVQTPRLSGSLLLAAFFSVYVVLRLLTRPGTYVLLEDEYENA